MSELNSKALSPPAPVHFKEVNMFLTGGQGTYFPLSQTLHSQSDHQAILRCQNIIQTRIMSLHYVRLLNDVSFSSQLSDLFLLTTPSCHSSPLHTNGCSELLCRKDCSSYQESKPISWFARGLCHCQTIWRHLARFYAADRHVHWNILVKSHKKANSIATRTANFCWARGPSRS